MGVQRETKGQYGDSVFERMRENVRSLKAIGDGDGDDEGDASPNDDDDDDDYGDDDIHVFMQSMSMLTCIHLCSPCRC